MWYNGVNQKFGSAVMAKYKLKFLFDWGSGVCLWCTNQAAKELYGDYPVETSKLAISETTKNELENLIYWHDEALNWSDPGGDLLWNDKQINDFWNTAKKWYCQLCRELGSGFEVELVERM